MPTTSSSSDGVSEEGSDLPPFRTDRGDEAPSPSTPELEDPDLPYAGLTWTEGGIILGAFALITAILIVNMLTGAPCCRPSTDREFFFATLSRSGYHLLLALTTIPVFWACVRLHPRTKGWGPTLAGHSVLALLLAFLLQMGREMTVYGLVHAWPPPSGKTPSLPSPMGELANFTFLDELVPYLAILGIGFVREGYLRGKARREQAEELEREAEQLRSKLTEARLKSLRMQINPHFFHNTLHTISTMAGRDPDGIRRATARLSDMMRHVLSTSDQQEVPLEEELDVLESYLDIQKLRLDDRLDVTFDVDPAVRRALVPTLLLQPLAENAVKHGFEGADETGHLLVRATREDEILVLEVADDGRGLPEDGTTPAGTGDVPDPTDDEEGVGLQNIAERLDGLYGDAATLNFKQTQDGGLRVVIRLPFHTPESERSLRTSGVVAE